MPVELLQKLQILILWGSAPTIADIAHVQSVAPDVKIVDAFLSTEVWFNAYRILTVDKMKSDRVEPFRLADSTSGDFYVKVDQSSEDKRAQDGLVRGTLVVARGCGLLAKPYEYDGDRDSSKMYETV